MSRGRPGEDGALKMDSLWHSAGLAGKLAAEDAQRLSGFDALQKRLRRRLMPAGRQIAEEAMARCGLTADQLTTAEVRAGFSALLRRVCEVEFEIYREYERRCSKEIMSQLLRLESPTLRRLAEGILARADGRAPNEVEYLIEASRCIYDELYDHFQHFYNSLANSRKSRAGGSFELQLGNLLRLAGYDYRLHTTGATEGGQGTRIDFIFPNDERFFRQNPGDCVGLSAKRTLRERWQNAVKELRDLGIGNIYLCTLETAANIAPNKVDELQQAGIKLVVTEDVKEAKFADRPTVVGYHKLVNAILELRLQLAG